MARWRFGLLFGMCQSFIGCVSRGGASFRLPGVLVLKIENFFVFFIFPPLAYLSWCLVFPSKSSFSSEFLCPFFFSNLVFLVALDPSHFSFRRFFVGVCRIAESEGRAVDFGDLVPSGCVLRRLSKELFDLVFPALDT